MTSFPLEPRYERKFIAQGLDLPATLALVRRHPAAFREVYPARGVNNLYLDSADLRDYHDHVNGVGHRAKTRIRWYGPWSGQLGAPTLEKKIKRGQVSWKRSHGLASMYMNGGVSRDDLARAVEQSALPLADRETLHHLQPSLLSRYQRHYFLSADRRFRLTVDSELEFAAASPAEAAGTGFRPYGSLIVIELKFGVGEAPDAPHVTNTLPFRLTKCSKYVLGITSILGR